MSQPPFYSSKMPSVVFFRWLRPFVPFFFLFFFFLLASQPSFSSPPLYFFHHINMSHGLSHRRVNNIYRDCNGFLWFCTPWSLDRFDGYKVMSFVPDFTNLKGNNIQRVDDYGTDTLIVSMETGFYIFDKKSESFSSASLFFHSHGARFEVERVLVDRYRNLWMMDRHHCVVGTPDGRSYAITMPSSDVAIANYCDSPSGVVLLLSNGRMMVCSAPTYVDLPSPLVFSTPFEGGVRTLHADHLGNLWAISAAGDALWTCSQTATKWIPFQMHMSDETVRLCELNGIVEDSEGLIWLSSDGNGLYVIDRKNNEVVNVRQNVTFPNGLKSNSCTCVASDDKGSIYIGYADAGLSVYNAKSFKFACPLTVEGSHRALRLDVRCISDSHDGYAYLGTHGHGLWKVNMHTYEAVAQQYCDLENIDNIEFLPDGSLWCGSLNDGLRRRKDGRCTSFVGRTDVSPVLASSSVTSLTADNECRLWVASGNRVACVMGDFRETIDTVCPVSIVAMRPAKEGGVFILSYGGILWAKETNGVIDILPLTLHNAVCSYPTDIMQDSRDMVWITTRGGVSGFKWNKFTKALDLQVSYNIGEVAVSVAEDEKQNIVVGSSCHVSIVGVTPVGVATDSLYSFSLRTFSQSDGLLPEEINPRATRCMSNGAVWVGASRGINVYKAKDVSIDDGMSKPIFGTLYIDGHQILPGEEVDGVVPLPQALSYCDEIRLPESCISITVGFSTLDFLTASGLTYLFEIEGHHVEPVETKEPHVMVANMGPGSYRLNVWVCGQDGTVSETPSSLSIIVVPLWYHTSWFYTICMILVLVAVGSIVYLITRRRYLFLYEAGKTDDSVSADSGTLLDIQCFKSEVLTYAVQDMMMTLETAVSGIEGVPRAALSAENRLRLLKLRDLVTQAEVNVRNLIEEVTPEVMNADYLMRLDIVDVARSISEKVDLMFEGRKRVSFCCSDSSVIVETNPLTLRRIIIGMLLSEGIDINEADHIDVWVGRSTKNPEEVDVCVSSDGKTSSTIVDRDDTIDMCVMGSPLIELATSIGGRVRLLVNDSGVSVTIFSIAIAG